MDLVDSVDSVLNHESVLSWLFAPKAKKATLITTSTMVLLPSMKRVLLCLLSLVLLISYQTPIDVQHSKSTKESTMSVTSQMVNSAITAMRDEANTTSNKWLTLEAWKTILYHYYDLDDTEADIHRPSMLRGGMKQTRRVTNG